ncbi:MAG TPA: hypothetical protein DET40_24810 [Lentisphaeria bacterium]|nr:MAG: hypothetical protein A2X45_01195 [Lentisphaerae bacterium GWF2_50_93]HCE46782.1 hypothetical protein [Lentisphaeria bacterium]
MGTKFLASFLLIFCLSGYELSAQQTRQIELDEYSVHRIKVGFDKSVTTVMFPSALSAIAGANVVTDSATASGDFLLSYLPGNYFFSIRALKKNARGSLNIVYNRKTYVIELEESAEEPSGSVTFISSKSSSRNRKKSVTSSVLLSLLDKAKAYALFKKHHPEAIADVQYVKSGQKILYDRFSITIDEIFRFDGEDTVVFRILLNNGSGTQIVYDPRMMAARLGETIYYASITDASGIIPPNSSIPAYFAITGTPTGGWNNLSADNRWSIIVSPDDLEKADKNNKKEEEKKDKEEKND